MRLAVLKFYLHALVDWKDILIVLIHDELFYGMFSQLNCGCFILNLHRKLVQVPLNEVVDPYDLLECLRNSHCTKNEVSHQIFLQ